MRKDTLYGILPVELGIIVKILRLVKIELSRVGAESSVSGLLECAAVYGCVRLRSPARPLIIYDTSSLGMRYFLAKAFQQ